MPDGEVPPGAGDVAVRYWIAVRQQHRGGGAVGLDAHRIDGEHVGPVDEIGDAAEALRLALGAIGAARAVEAGERGVRVRVAQSDDFKGERLRRNGGDAERTFLELIVLGRQGFAVERKTLKRQAFAIEHEGAPARRHLGVGPQSELCGDARRLRVERDVEFDLLDEIIGRGVVFEEFGLAGGLVHGLKTIPSPSLLESGARDAKSLRQFC